MAPTPQINSSLELGKQTSEAIDSRVVIAIATYNEIENLPRLVYELRELTPWADILVIDDNSPDGTGDWCDEFREIDPQLSCLHREGKAGLGSATYAGMQYAIENDYEYILTMDADFSHAPEHAPALIKGLDESDEIDVMIGSRYAPGGGVVGWPFYRRLMSRTINLYARTMLGLTSKDCSGAFRCYRTANLKELDFTSMRSSGYSYLEEILWRLKRTGATFDERPIIFVDREFGKTKINLREAVSAVLIIARLGVKNWFGV